MRSQTNSTRFWDMNSEHDNVKPSRYSWQPFRVWARCDIDDFEMIPIGNNSSVLKYNLGDRRIKRVQSNSYLQYGQVVVLEHIKTGMCTEELTIRPIQGKNTVVMQTPSSLL